MKEYKILNSKMNAFGSKALGTLYVLENALRQSSYSIIKFDVLRKEMSDILDFMELRHRFDELVEQSNNTLSVTDTGFILDNHTLETLDEVERALKLKAFL